MLTQTGVTEKGDVIVYIVKAPVESFESDYKMWNTEANRAGMVLRRNFAPCREQCVFNGLVGHHDEFIIPSDKEPYQGTITRAEVEGSAKLNLFGISDYSRSQKQLIAELGEGETKLTSPVYDRYLLDCETVPSGIVGLSLFSDLKVFHSDIGSIETQNYSSVQLNGVYRIGSIYALTYEPEGTVIRLAFSFDGHQTYYVFDRKRLVPISGDPHEILEKGNNRSELCYGFRNRVPDADHKKVDFKIVLHSKNAEQTPVFYGFRCCFYSTIPGNSVCVDY